MRARVSTVHTARGPRDVRRPRRYAPRAATRAVTLAIALIAVLAFGAQTNADVADIQPQLLPSPSGRRVGDEGALTGTAAYNYRIADAAEYHGLSLAGRHGCAVLDCSLIGRFAWVHVADQWLGPLVIVDCTAAHHRHLWKTWGRVVDIPWSLWEALGLPLTPVPALVTFDAPPAGAQPR